jgi:cytochrome c peroxidase
MTYRQTASALPGTAVALLSLSVVFSGNVSALELSEADYDLKLLGKYVFFDRISTPPRMACVTCHDPATGGTGSVSGVNRRQVAITGANPHKVGNLKPPTNAYASLIPPLHNNAEGCVDGVPQLCGGNFWNSRAEGAYPPLFPQRATKHIGDEVYQGTAGLDYSEYFGATADQALNPMPNPVEQNIDRQSVCRHVASAKYAALYKKAWGVEIDCRDVNAAESADDVVEPEKEFDISFKRIMLAVGAWQHSRDNNSFSSKRDIALAHDGDGLFPLDDLTDEENLGHDLFYGIASDLNPTGKSAGCAACHSDNPGSDTGEEPEQLYSDDAFHNIGTPRNPEIPNTGSDPDLGLAGLTNITPTTGGSCGPGFNRNCDHRGFFKTTTVRNVDKRKGYGFTKAYAHNGWFKSLESIVHFYNTADVRPFRPDGITQTTASTFGITRCPGGIQTEKDALANNCWPAPAYANPSQGGSPTFGAILPGAAGARFGDLQLTLEEEAAIVAYMNTLTDTHTAKAPPPYKTPKK